MKITEEAYERAKKIRLVIFDVDGVLTDGGTYMGESGGGIVCNGEAQTASCYCFAGYRH